MRKIAILQLLLSLYVVLFAQIPTGYYSSAEGKTGATLKTTLSSIISANSTDVGYDGLYTVYKTSDVLPNGKVWDMYSAKADGTASYYFSNVDADRCGNYSKEGDCFNREHTFCDSWLGKASPQRSDAHHILPTDGYVNNQRSSYPHGKVGNVTWTSTNGSKLGTSDASTGYTGIVFEPIDAYKGDFARMYFYVATRYESQIAGWVNNGTASEILAGNSYPAYKTWFLNLMLAWSRQDPVSQKEIDRNNAIYTYQNNRNPFIDYPNLAEYVWGNLNGQPWSSSASNVPYLSSPANGITYDFGDVSFLQSKKYTINIKGSNLTGGINISLSGQNQSLFALSVSSVTKEQAEAGYDIEVSYSATSLGNHSAQLQLSGGGITTSTINLAAKCVDGFGALSASNITSNSFTANWNASGYATSYILDVYSKKYIGGGAPVTLTEEEFVTFPSTWKSWGYTAIENGMVRLASGNNNGTIKTPSLNLSTPGTVTVKAKQYNNDTGATLYLSIGNTSLTSWNTTNNVDTYTYDLPALGTDSLTFSALKNKRVLIDYIKVATKGGTISKESVTGYPLNTGNVLTYNVTGLMPDSAYYYQVKVADNTAIVSTEISLRTNSLTSAGINKASDIYWKNTIDGILLLNTTPGQRIEIYTLTGNKTGSLVSTQNKLDIKLPQRGFYIIKTSNNNYIKISH